MVDEDEYEAMQQHEVMIEEQGHVVCAEHDGESVGSM